MMPKTEVTVMLEFELIIEKDARKFFDKHEDVLQRYKDSLREYLTGKHPERIDIKILEGKQNKYYRMKLGKWRIIFIITGDTVRIIDTLLAGSR